MSRLSGIPFEVAVDFGSMATGATDTEVTTVPGARFDRGDAVIFGSPVSGTWQGLTVTAEINADNSVRFLASNNSGGTVNASAKTVKGIVIPGDLLSG